MPGMVLLGLCWAGLPEAAEQQEASAAIKYGDFATAHRLLAPAAEAGDAEALYLLGTLHANGEGVKADLARAQQLFRVAAAKGHAAAQLQLQSMQQLGLLAPQAPPPDAAWRVQLATVLREGAGEAEWKRLKRLYREELADLSLSVLPYSSATGDTLYRVQAGPLSEEAARALCQALKDRQKTCRVIRPSE
jgi:TPR repeat protein